MSLYMVIENLRNGEAVPVYRRFRDRGRLAPTGLSYVSSWVSDKLDGCYHLMETEDRVLLEQWIASWSDIVDFEVYPVISSKEAAEKTGPGCKCGCMMARAALGGRGSLARYSCRAENLLKIVSGTKLIAAMM